MPRRVDRRKRERAPTLGLPRQVCGITGRPVTPLFRRIPFCAAPFELVRPKLVGHPVALPVVRPGVEKYAYAAVQ